VAEAALSGEEALARLNPLGWSRLRQGGLKDNDNAE